MNKIIFPTEINVKIILAELCQYASSQIYKLMVKYHCFQGWFKQLFLFNMPSLFFLKSTNNQLTAYSNTNPWMFKKHYFCLRELAAIQKAVHLFVSALKIFIRLQHGNQYAFSNLDFISVINQICVLLSSFDRGSIGAYLSCFMHRVLQ